MAFHSYYLAKTTNHFLSKQKRGEHNIKPLINTRLSALWYVCMIHENSKWQPNHNYYYTVDRFVSVHQFPLLQCNDFEGIYQKKPFFKKSEQI